MSEFLRGGNNGKKLELSPDPSIDELYRVLSDYRRRVLLYLFSISGEQVHSVSSLAVRIAQLEDDETEPSEIWVELRHKHLPMLADSGLIEYDTRSNTVVYTGSDLVESLLAPARERENQEE